MNNSNTTVRIDINTWRSGLSRPDWWSAPWIEISDLPILPNGTRLADDVWISPRGWHKKYSSLKFINALPSNWYREEARSEALLRRLKRFAAIDFTASVRGSLNKPFGPGHWLTWLYRNRSLHAAAKAAAAENLQSNVPTRCPDGEPLFAVLTPAALEEVLPVAYGPRYKLVSRLNALFGADLIDDWPAADVMCKGNRRQHSNSNVTQSFSDQSFTILCQAAFAVAALQEEMLACYQEISAIEANEEGYRDNKRSAVYRRERLTGWESSRLKRGAPLGVTLFIQERTGSANYGDLRHEIVRFDTWPFRTLGQVHQVLRFCQVANWIILAAATGARAGELDALTRDALTDFVPAQWGSNNRDLALLNGMTFKTETFSKNRQWPLPSHAVKAFERQLCLVQELSPRGKSLWFARRDDESVHIYHRLRYFCNSVSIDGKNLIKFQIEGGVNAQRFRETLSRLIGLCLDNGHHVLFDVLGHREMDTTIGYMMSDPDFAAQSRRVKLESEAVRKRHIIKSADKMLGPAAKDIARLRNIISERSFDNDADAGRSSSSEIVKTIAEFSEIMSNDEMELILPHASIVRPGIYCIAGEAQPGLCSKSTIRDVSRCSPLCHHRLEEAAANDDRRRSVRYILEKMKDRTMTTLQRAFYRRQLFDQFFSTPTLVYEFLDDPRLRSALADISVERIAMLPDGPREKLVALLAGEV